MQCRLRRQQYKDSLEIQVQLRDWREKLCSVLTTQVCLQVQGLQEQLKRCEDDLKHTMTQRNYFKGYFDKCCGRDMLRHNTNLPLNLEMINNNHEQQDFKR